MVGMLAETLGRGRAVESSDPKRYDSQKSRKSPSSNRPDVPKVGVMRARIILGLVLGVAGICLGVVGAVFTNAYLAIAAGCCAIAGCFLIGGATLLPLLQRTNDQQPTSDLKNRLEGLPHRPGTGTGSSGRLDIPDQSVIDPVTELPDGRYFEVAVESRVAAARRHLWPVSVVLIQLGFSPDGESIESRNRSLVSFANVMRQTLREADIACRMDETTFGLILEDTSEEGGVWTAERLQIALAHDTTTIRRLVAGVAAYPTHGLFSKDVLIRAQAALQRASSTPAGHGLGQVEVAHVDLS
jgi:diguanylate cyclase (GGDEF)-like protein